MNKRSLVIAMAVTGLLLFGASIAYTQGLAFPGLASPASPPVPHLINYQGRLTNTAGNPLNGSYPMTFTLYSEPTGGTPLWTETQTVPVTRGVFSVLLGNAASISSTVFDGSDRWLGVKVGSDSEMVPRRRVVSVGYAYRAEDANNADTVDGLHASSVPTSTTLFPLDASSKFTNAVLYTGHGNGLDADKVDGLHASQVPTASGCGWFYSGTCPAGWTQVTTGEWGACVWGAAVVPTGPYGGCTGGWQEAMLKPAGASTCPIGNYQPAGTAAFCCGAIATVP